MGISFLSLKPFDAGTTGEVVKYSREKIQE
jgi:hypothetical protein